MTNTPTNCTLSVSRSGSTVEGLTAIPALTMPARPEVFALREVPAGKAFEIYFREVIAGLRESDRLVDDATAETYRIIGIADYNTPHGAHTEVIAESKLGL